MKVRREKGERVHTSQTNPPQRLRQRPHPPIAHVTHPTTQLDEAPRPIRGDLQRRCRLRGCGRRYAALHIGQISNFGEVGEAVGGLAEGVGVV